VGHDDDRRLDDERQRWRRPSARRFMHLQRERHHLLTRLRHLESPTSPPLSLRSEFLRGRLTVSLDTSDVSNLAFCSYGYRIRQAGEAIDVFVALIDSFDRQTVRCDRSLIFGTNHPV
jgi:hypothetical protein